jgi:hypothetical protein
MEVSRNPTLHIESDVVLSNDFPLQKFEEMSTPFAFPIVSDKRGIASAVYIRDVEAAQFLWEFVKACVNRDALASDMEILFQFHRDYPAHVTTLPIAPSELFANQEDVLNNTKFDGYFDGHDFGVYLAGTNPWNQRGLSRLHTKMNGSLLDFKADNLYFNKERNFLSLRGDSGIEYPLYSLHITNKNPYFFSVRFGPLFIRLWSERRFLRNITFHPIVFVFMIFNFLRRKINRVVAGLTHQRLQPKNPPKL